MLGIQSESRAQIDEIFSKLSAGGSVTMPLDKTFWSPRFGMLTDKFGIKWMLNLGGGFLAMSERAQYPPGVPCWVDTLQPDPGGGDAVLRRALRLADRRPGRDAGHAARRVLRRAAARARRRGNRVAAAARRARRRRGLEHATSRSTTSTQRAHGVRAPAAPSSSPPTARCRPAGSRSSEIRRRDVLRYGKREIAPARSASTSRQRGR